MRLEDPRAPRSLVWGVTAAGLFIPSLLMLLVWAVHNVGRSEALEDPNRWPLDAVAVSIAIEGGLWNVPPFLILAWLTARHIKLSGHRSSARSLPGSIGLWISGLCVFSFSIYIHAWVWHVVFGPAPVGSTISVNHVIAPLIGAILLAPGYGLGWVIGRFVNTWRRA